MSNELKDIANRLCDYNNDKGWQITKAEKIDGKWNLILEEIVPALQEATNDKAE